MTTPMWEGYSPSGESPIIPDYEQPPHVRDGTAIDLDFLPGTLEDVRAEALAAYAISLQAETARLRAETHRRVDDIYDAVHDYVDLLEETGFPGGMKLKIVPDGVEPSTSKESDVVDGILWPLVPSLYNNNQEPHIAIGPDGRLYDSWIWDKNAEKLTYSRAAYAPLDLYAENDWHRIEGIEQSLDLLEIPVESNLEVPPEGALNRNGADIPAGIDLDSVRAEAMAAYSGETEAEKWATFKPTIEQLDAIYADARLLAELWREGGLTDAITCSILPDMFDPQRFNKDELISGVMLPLHHLDATAVKDMPDYMLGPEGRLYSIRSVGYKAATRTADYHFYVPLDLYTDDGRNAIRVPKILQGLDSASKATR